MRYDASFDDGIAHMPMIRAATTVADYFEVPYPMARSIVQACREAYDLGSEGKPHPEPLATEELRDLVWGAWSDGITKKDRVTVRLSDSEGSCGECGNCVAEHEDACKSCKSTDICRMALAVVSDPFAEEWAEGDQYIDGSTWESCGNGEIYTILVNRPGLYDELKADGYRVDATDYNEVGE